MPTPRIVSIAVALVIAGVIGGAPAAAQQAGRAVAVTFDDLPGITQGDRSVAGHARITEALLRRIAEHRVPAIGFVNEDKLRTDGRVDPRRVDLLRRWTSAGLELGNHAYSHMDLHANPVEAFIADVARGDSVTRLVLADAGTRPRFFRHPFLHTGRTPEDRRRFETWLAERGYRVAPVTIDNSDYIFAAAYDLAPADSLRRVADEYIRYMEATAEYYEQQSRALFGREIAQVLLLHANNLNADHFGRLAEMYARRGYVFVPLEQALRDPAYASEDTYTGPAGITWIHRWALTQGKRGAFFAGEPEVPAWVTDLARPQENPRMQQQPPGR
ncbi:polysaccharide deacetylase family protein [Longimicrobium sp.]|uniref:polysaccharide deacetylase family protein n=1 Tax=Longimicrobium sp. TaxID=2029185 RepID=UPI002E2F0759|nr:polysaccharide deacetylase family protein [Longimicrobium sp.]HEX6041394.1 polysaccharide deacetylase family protein [Longimicrobium sp.]